MIEAGIGPAPPDWPKAGDEIRAQDFGPFDRDALARYAAVSGDDNPLHLDPNAARAAGLARHSSYVSSSSFPFSAKPPGVNCWQLAQNSDRRNADDGVKPPCGS